MLSASALAPAANRLIPDEYATIQAAIDECVDGDVVIVAPGTYTGPGNRDIDFLGKAITVRSIDPNDPNVVAATIIDCEGSEAKRHRGFKFHSEEGLDSVLCGITIINGYGPKEQIGSYTRSHGGAIFCNNSSPTIKNCIISGNWADYDGGGIFCFDHSSPTISNCIIRENSAGYNGGGLYCSYSSPPIHRCTIADNSALRCGGGIYFWHSSSTISYSIISHNSTCLVPGGLGGGGIYCFRCNLTINHCMITGNSSGLYGGGFHCTLSNLTICHCIFTGNAAGYGGAICSYANSNPTAYNCILWANSAIHGSEIAIRTSHSPSQFTALYSNIQGGEEAVYISPNCILNWNVGNTVEDPLFYRPGYWEDNNIWIEGDYHLLPFSTCIDSGDPNYAAEPNETDFDGNPRVIGGRIDMGAYESNYIEVAMKFTPQALNPDSRGKWVKAHFVLPAGFMVEDVDAGKPAKIEPLGIESEYINVFINEDGLVEIEAAFGRAAFCSAATDYGPAEVTVVGLLASGQNFYGTDTIKIINKSFEYIGVLSSHWLEGGCGAPDWCGGGDLDHSSVVDFVDFAIFDGCCIEVIRQ